MPVLPRHPRMHRRSKCVQEYCWVVHEYCRVIHEYCWVVYDLLLHVQANIVSRLQRQADFPIHQTCQSATEKRMLGLYHWEEVTPRWLIVVCVILFSLFQAKAKFWHSFHSRCFCDTDFVHSNRLPSSHNTHPKFILIVKKMKKRVLVVQKVYSNTWLTSPISSSNRPTSRNRWHDFPNLIAWHHRTDNVVDYTVIKYLPIISSTTAPTQCINLIHQIIIPPH